MVNFSLSVARSYRRHPSLFLCHLTDRSDQTVVGVGLAVDPMQGKPLELRSRFGRKLPACLSPMLS